MRAALRSSGAGQCQVILIDGPVGGGKSELLQAFTESASAQDGVLVLTALGSPAEASMPCGLLSQLFRPVQAPPQSIEAVSRMLEIVTAEWNGCATAELIPSDLLFELSAQLQELAEQHLVVLCVDDIQHADTPSLDILLFFMRRLRSARILFVLTEAEHGLRRNPVFRTELLRHPRFSRMRLAPLSPAGVAQVVAGHLRTGPRDEAGPDLAAEYHAMSGGNPLLTRALADDLALGTGNGERIGGGSFAQAVLVCLYRGTPTMLVTARTLAVLDGPASPDTIAQLLDLPVVIAVQALDDLASAGLVLDEALRYPAIRAAILSDMSPDDRADLHRRIARLAHRRGDPDGQIAGHLLAAGHVGERWAATILKAAANQALHHDQTTAAVELLDLALTAELTVEERIDLTMLQLQAEWRVKPAASARLLGPLIQAFWDERLPLGQAILLIRFLLWHGRLHEVARILDSLTVTEHPDPVTAGELALLAQRIRTSFPSLDGRIPLASAEPGVVPMPLRIRIRAADLLAEVMTGWTGPEAAHEAEKILRQASLDDSSLEAIEGALAALVYLDRAGTAADLCEPFLAEAAQRGAPSWSAALSALRAEIALRQGDPIGAERYGRAALSYISVESWGVMAAAPLSSLVSATTTLGRPEEATALLLSHPVTEITQNSRFGLHYLHARGRHHLAVHRHHAALADFLNCGELMTRWNLDLPTIVPWRSEASTVLLRLGDREQAARLAEEQLVMAGTEPSRCRGLSLRAAAAAISPDHRPPLLEEAEAIFNELGDLLELAYTYADLSAVYQALGDAERAKHLHSQALRLAESRQAGPLCDALRKRVPAAHRPSCRPSLAPLSDAERRVASLAAEGCTNREIALTLFITMSTVEQHLTRVYRKLNVQARSDLRRLLSPAPITTS